MKKRITLLCVAAATIYLTIGAASHEPRGGPVPYASESGAAVPSPRAAVTAYTLAQRQTYTPAGGQTFLRAEKTRLQRSDGLFAVTHTYYRRDGSTEVVETGVGFLGVGLFRADEHGGRLEFLAPPDEEGGAATEEQLKADPDHLREEVLLGQRILVARYGGGKADAGRYREVWRAPALRNFELKTVAATPRGTELTEPTELRLGEPDETVFRRLAHLPRSYARFEERIREAERRGEAELAERLRRHLERARR